MVFAAFWFVSKSVHNDSGSTFFISPAINNTEGTGAGPQSGESNQAPIEPQKKLTAQEELAKSLSDANKKALEVKKEIAALEEEGKISPLAKKLTIAGVNGAGATNSSNEYIVLRASNANTQSILLTGLRLQSGASGRGANIPKAVALPFQNQVNTETPVFLGPGEIAYIITGRSPLGMSFRLNECTGFYNQYQSFNPGLPSRCPAPRSEPLPPPANQYNDGCLDYINSLPSCQVIVSTPLGTSHECTRYVTTELNYTKCVERHKNDVDFYDPTWQIYLGRDDALWKNRREVINLLDQNDKVIDATTY